MPSPRRTARVSSAEPPPSALNHLDAVARRIAHEDARAVALDRDAGIRHPALDRAEIVDDEPDMRPFEPRRRGIEGFQREMQLHRAGVVPRAFVLARARRLGELREAEQRAVE